jgi:hypothetical protein
MNRQSAVPSRWQMRSFLLCLCFGYLDERFARSYESSICRAVSMADAKFSAVGCAMAISMSAFAREDESSICRAVSMADAKFSAVGCALGYLDERFAR